MSDAQEIQISWQDDANDMPHRRVVIRQITKLLQDRKEDPDPKWVQQLPFKVRKLEEQLYQNAPSLETYADEKTLKQRLKKAAISITRQIRIEKAYQSGLWSRPSPRNSISSSRRVSVSSPLSLTGMGSDVWQTSHLLQSPVLPLTAVDSSSSNADLWDAAASATTSLWDVPTRRISTLWDDAVSPLDLSPKKPPLPQVGVPRSSISELSNLQAANRKLQNDILEKIRRQQDTLRTMSNVVPQST